MPPRCPLSNTEGLIPTRTVGLIQYSYEITVEAQFAHHGGMFIVASVAPY